MSVTVDPVTVEVIRNGFLSIARQMNNNLVRSAYTPIIYEMHDCSVGVFDRKGRLLGQSPGLPMFLGNLELGIVQNQSGSTLKKKQKHLVGWVESGPASSRSDAFAPVIQICGRCKHAANSGDRTGCHTARCEDIEAVG